MTRKRKGLDKREEMEQKFLEENLDDIKAIAEGNKESEFTRNEAQEYLEYLEGSE